MDVRCALPVLGFKVCAAQVTDLALHKQWHAELDASLRALQPVQRAADN